MEIDWGEKVRQITSAAARGRTEWVLELHKAHPLLIEMPYIDQTAAHHAAFHGQTATVQAIARIDPALLAVQTYGGSNAAHAACRFGHGETALAIMAIDPQLFLVPDIDGRTPTHIAAKWCHPDVAREITEALDAALAPQAASARRAAVHKFLRNLGNVPKT